MHASPRQSLEDTREATPPPFVKPPSSCRHYHTPLLETRNRGEQGDRVTPLAAYIKGRMARAYARLASPEPRGHQGGHPSPLRQATFIMPSLPHPPPRDTGQGGRIYTREQCTRREMVLLLAAGRLFLLTFTDCKNTRSPWLRHVGSIQSVPLRHPPHTSWGFAG